MVAMQTPARSDHRRLEQLVEELLVALESDDAHAIASAWSRLEAELLAHFEAEETHLIPELVRTSQRDARVIIGEHRHLRSRISELGATARRHTLRPETARNFISELRAHARNEDRLLYSYPRAQ